ncbi:uncharacterized protein [Antedon mediterranea]|uniref:uncharacterized protein isoform X2 n=1 Tax=Antedon mediterranea TaxID=105859 RepID=UPI003AF9492C
MYKCFCFALLCFITIGAQGKNSGLELENLLLRYFLEKSADKVETRVGEPEAPNNGGDGGEDNNGIYQKKTLSSAIANSEVENQDFMDAMLYVHNHYRNLHCNTDALEHLQTLSDHAQTVADDNAEAGELEHSTTSYGENLYRVQTHVYYGEFNQGILALNAAKAWYGEQTNYNYNNPGSSEGAIGHFTQVVWKTTDQLGCAYNKVDGENGYYTVYVTCNYSPTGNVYGENGTNVDYRKPGVV